MDMSRHAHTWTNKPHRYLILLLIKQQVKNRAKQWMSIARYCLTQGKAHRMKDTDYMKCAASR